MAPNKIKGNKISAGPREDEADNAHCAGEPSTEANCQQKENGNTELGQLRHQFYQSQIEKLKNEVESFKKEAAKASQEAANLKAELSQRADEVSHLRSCAGELDDLKTAKDVAAPWAKEGTEYYEQDNVMENVSRVRESAINEINNLKAQLEERGTEVERLQEDALKSQDVIKEREAEIQRLKSSSTGDGNLAKLEALEKQTAQQDEDFANAQQRIAELKVSLADAGKALESETSLRNSQEQQLGWSQQRVSYLESSLLEMRTQLADARQLTEADAKEAASLRTTLGNENEKRNKQEQELLCSKQRVSDLEASLLEMRAEIERQTSLKDEQGEELSTAQEQNEELEKSLTSITTKFEDLTSLSKAQHEELTVSNQKIEELQRMLADPKVETENGTSVKDGHDQELLDFNEKIKELEGINEEMASKAALQDEELTQFKERVAELEGSLGVMQKKLENQASPSREADEVSGASQTNSTELETSEPLKAELEASVANLKVELSRETSLRHAAQQQAAESEVVLANLREELSRQAELRKEEEEKHQEKQELEEEARQRVAELEVSLADAREELAHQVPLRLVAQEQTEAAQRRILELEAQLAEVSAEEDNEDAQSPEAGENHAGQGAEKGKDQPEEEDEKSKERRKKEEKKKEERKERKKIKSELKLWKFMEEEPLDAQAEIAEGEATQATMALDIASMSKDMEILRAKLAGTERDLTMADHKNDLLMQQLADKDQLLKKPQMQLRAKDRKIDQLQRKVDEKEDRIQRITKRLEDARTSLKQQTSHVHEAAEAKRDELAQQVTDAHREQASAEERIWELQDQVKELQYQLGGKGAALEDAQADSKQLKYLEKQVRERDAALEEAEAEVTRLSSKIEEESKKSRYMSERLRDAETGLARALSESSPEITGQEELRRESAELRTQLRRTRQRCQELEAVADLRRRDAWPNFSWRGSGNSRCDGDPGADESGNREEKQRQHTGTKNSILERLRGEGYDSMSGNWAPRSYTPSVYISDEVKDAKARSLPPPPTMQAPPPPPPPRSKSSQQRWDEHDAREGYEDSTKSYDKWAWSQWKPSAESEDEGRRGWKPRDESEDEGRRGWKSRDESEDEGRRGWKRRDSTEDEGRRGSSDEWRKWSRLPVTEEESADEEKGHRDHWRKGKEVWPDHRPKAFRYDTGPVEPEDRYDWRKGEPPSWMLHGRAAPDDSEDERRRGSEDRHRGRDNLKESESFGGWRSSTSWNSDSHPDDSRDWRNRWG